MLAPVDAPKWCLDAQTFWDANDAWESRANARLCRECVVALPSELSPADRQALAIALGQALVDRYQVVVLVAIHEPDARGDQRNHHAHLLMSARQVGAGGFGARAGAEFDARGGKGADAIREVRAIVSKVINEHLATAGLEQRVDHRTLRAQARDAAAQGDYARAIELTRPPTRHIGRAVMGMLRRGERPERLNDLRVPPSQRDAIEALLANATREGRAQPVSLGHSHDAAVRDVQREHGEKPRSRIGLDASPKTSHAGIRPKLSPRSAGQGAAPRLQLSQGGRIARSSGTGSEVLNAQARLIEEWLASQMEIAQQALESLQVVPGLRVEPVLDEAMAILDLRRAQAHSAKTMFREDIEGLTSAIGAYARAILVPHEKRDAARRTKARLSEAERDAKVSGATNPELAQAKADCERAARRLSQGALGLDESEINQARRAMTARVQYINQMYPLAALPVPEEDSEQSSPERVAPAKLETWTVGHLRPRL